MGCCPSDWWQAPVYLTVSLVLAFLAISTAIHSLPNDAARNQHSKPVDLPLSLNASNVLHRFGFTAVATLLHISPEIFLSSPNSTIFAIKDSALFNTSLPPWFLKHLLQYHTSPLKLPMDDLLKKPQDSCFPTLLPPKNIALTRVDASARKVEINHVQISHPDIFLQGPLVIHGVLGPFSSLDPQNVRQGWDYIQSPVCDSKSSLVLDISKANNMVDIEWIRIIRLLSSSGFVSFAIGLHSVLDRILEDHKNLTAITVLAPPNLAIVAYPSPFLYNVVRHHILLQRLTYKDLASQPNRATLRTLIPHQDLQIIGGDHLNASLGLAVGGVQIMAPDMFSSNTFVIHGISQALKDPEPNASF